MIDMCVRQNHGIDLAHRQRQSLVLCARLRPPPLKQAAVEEQRLAPVPHDVARPRHLAGRTGELQFH